MSLGWREKGQWQDGKLVRQFDRDEAYRNGPAELNPYLPFWWRFNSALWIAIACVLAGVGSALLIGLAFYLLGWAIR